MVIACEGLVKTSSELEQEIGEFISDLGCSEGFGVYRRGFAIISDTRDKAVRNLTNMHSNKGDCFMFVIKDYGKVQVIG